MKRDEQRGGKEPSTSHLGIIRTVSSIANHLNASLCQICKRPITPAQHLLLLVSTWRQGPVETTNAVHVLSVLRLLDFAHSIVPIVAGHFSILRGTEILETHHALHLCFRILVL